MREASSTDRRVRVATASRAYLSTINRDNRHRSLRNQSTNPCGEQPLLPYESCVLVLSTWRVLSERESITSDCESCRIGVRFLDNIIDVMNTCLNRRTADESQIGLGVMAWADLLILMGIPYDLKYDQRRAGHGIHLNRSMTLDRTGKTKDRRGG
jgi:ribonucleotide reductase alpha subunit